MLAIELVRSVCDGPWSEWGRTCRRYNRVTLTKGDEELGVVRVLSAIVRHTDQATVDEPQAWVYLILEGLCALSVKT